MSEVKVNKISPRSGTDVTLGDSGDTFTIPAGASIVNNGTQTGFGRTGTVDWQSTVKTASFTAVNGEGYFVNTTSSAVTMTLPAGSAGAIVSIKDYASTFNTNNLIIAANGSEKIGGSTDNATIVEDGIALTLIYIDSTQGWLVTSSGLQTEAPQTYSADFLVIGGGGGGGNDDSGGGGAGGYRTSTQDISPGTTYTVTVGDGGAGSTATPAPGANGSASSVSGTGLTTITSAGGGGGGTTSTAGADGGSGGGGSGNPGSAGGSGNIPATSPSQGNDGADGNISNYVGGGGGGAGEAGNTDGPSHGGDGLTSSITGSAVVRAGGGAGSNRINPQTPAPGGDGGGGTGGTDTPQNPATDGTVNTGSGGGGGGGSVPKDGGDGGKGVVIISVPTANYSGTTTGSPTVTTSGSNTIMQFNGSGSYTG